MAFGTTPLLQGLFIYLPIFYMGEGGLKEITKHAHEISEASIFLVVAYERQCLLICDCFML
jgi:hypothetical protein